MLEALDVDVVGLNFVPTSPRFVAAAMAREVAAAAGHCRLWGVFMDAPAADVRRVLEQVPLDTLQFHGTESPAYCAQFGLPFVKVVHMADGVDVIAQATAYAEARMLLLDTSVNGAAGGTGQVFDWRRWPRACGLPLMLAGGLTPANVGEAVRRLVPAGVDVAGGVEGSVKGLKDADKCRAFVAAVRDAQGGG